MKNERKIVIALESVSQHTVLTSHIDNNNKQKCPCKYFFSQYNL